MYSIPLQKTHKGRTAGGYIKDAEIVQMSSGDFMVITPTLDGVLLLAEESNMLLQNFDGNVLMMTLSNRALDRLISLLDMADKMTNEFVDGHIPLAEAT